MGELTHLGFTFYPKDWWTSDSFYTLNPFERYIYLELLFMMYDNEGSIKNDRVRVERRLGTVIKEDVWVKITDLMVKDGDHITHKSVNKRLRKTLANRGNGQKGGAPIGNENASKKQPKNNLKQPKTTHFSKGGFWVDFENDCNSIKNNPNNPKKQPKNNPKQPTLEIEREIEREYKSEDEVKNEVTPSPTFSDSDLIKDIDNLAKEALEDKVYFVEHVSRKFRLTPEAVKTSLMNFNEHLKSVGEMVKSKRDYRTHFQNWLRKQPVAVQPKKMKTI